MSTSKTIDPDDAYAEAYAEAYAQGVVEVHARMRAILESPEAETRPNVARMIATKTAMPADEALAFLAGIAPEHAGPVRDHDGFPGRMH